MEWVSKARGERVQKIVVFQERGSGEKKVAGIESYAPGVFELEIFSIDEALPPLLDEPGRYLPQSLRADLVLGFLRHPDLVDELFERCRKAGIPLVASGRKHPPREKLATPPI
jgi:hypothetical protein